MITNKIFIFGITLGLVFPGMIIFDDTMDLKNVGAKDVKGITLYVGGLGPGNYSSVQDAIDDASNGDTVFVYNGTYHESVVVPKGINLIGEGRETTIINGSGSGYCGIDITANNTMVTNMKITNCDTCGVSISGETIIRNCNISCNNLDGVWGTGEGVIEKNIISYNGQEGVKWWYGSPVITKNIIYENDYGGIGFYSYKQGKQQYIPYVTDNIIRENDGDGICVGWLVYTPMIIANTITDNSGIGIHIVWSGECIIYHNSLMNNFQNAFEESPGVNSWDNGSTGNYWSDYTGSDTDGDGIGDTPYNIPGGSNQDRYPLMNPWGTNHTLSHTFNLYQGWNLITIPVENAWTAETLGQNISGCTTVCRFNANSQSYATHAMGIPYNDFSIVDGTGYFVYCTHDSIFSMPDLSIPSANVSIFEEWNIVGWYHDSVTTAGSLGENISGTTVVCMFNGETQTFTTHVVGIPYNDFLIERGMALFIFVTDASYWHGEG